ncbi:MAG: methyltransferase [Chloroflexi bacterium]|nr:MAG: methyltransferase [Chloroflexota bacterium]
MDSEIAEALIREFTRVQAAPFVPEVQLYLADKLVPLWQATEWQAAGPQAPPFWAFAWPGSQALARYLIEAPETVAQRRVLDFGAGCGLAAIAAVMADASRVAAVDVDPLAVVAQRMNARLNGVAFEHRCQDLVGDDISEEVVLVGDVCYERETTERVVPWLRDLARGGALVLIADPGRTYAPVDGLELLATYDVPTLRELESVDQKRTRLWRLDAVKAT